MRLRFFARGVVGAIVLTVGLVTTGGVSPAAATGNCPTVDPITHAVSPAPEPGVDWSGCELSGANLRDAIFSDPHTGAFSNLSDADLSGANLAGANLDNVYAFRANLRGANLTGANLHHAYLTDATLDDSRLNTADLESVVLSGGSLKNASLRSSNLSGAYVDATDLIGADLTSVRSGRVWGTPKQLPTNWLVVKGYFTGPRANLVDADLSDASMHGADLAGADLTNANVSNTDLSSADLSGAAVTGINWSWSLLNGTNFVGDDLAGANLAGGELSDASLVGANLRGAILISAKLSRADLYKADLTDADLSCMNGTCADLSLANLTRSTLTGANLTSADLSGSSLAQANATKADFTSAQLRGTDISSIDLGASTLKGVSSGGLRGSALVLPAGWSSVNGYLVGPGANLLQANLAMANLAGTDLRSANLSSANLANANLDATNLTGARLSGARLIGATFEKTNFAGCYLIDTDMTGVDLTSVTGWEGANLSGAEMTGANLRNADLADADLTRANLSGTTLAGADLHRSALSWARSGKISGEPRALPPDWQLVKGYLLGPHADLGEASLVSSSMRGIDLSYAVLTGAHLHEADLAEVDLTDAYLGGADLSGVKSGGVRGQPDTLPSGWSLLGGYLLGPSANMSNAALRDMDLSGLNLANADFSNVDLTGADLTGADLTGVRWRNTTCTDGTNSNSHNGGSCLAPLDSVAPATTLTTNAASFTTSLAHRIGVAWSANDGTGSGIASYDVRYSKTSVVSIASPPWTAWQVSTKATSATINLASGYRYCFQSRARDAAGNTGAWGAQRCTNTAIDDHQLVASDGWREGSRAATFANTLTTTAVIGATLSKPASYVSQVGLIAITCPTCGTVDVYIGTHKLGSISLYSSTNNSRKVFMLPKLASRQYGTLKLVTVRSAIPSRNHVTIDGVLASV